MKKIARKRSGFLNYGSFLLFMLMILVSMTQVKAQATVKVVTDRPDALYSKNDPIDFNIEVLLDSVAVTGSVQYVISNDGVGILKQDSLHLKNGIGQVQWKQPTPMIVRCKVIFSSPGEKLVSGMAAAAVDPYEIQPTAIVPDDFEAYWKAQKNRLAKVPIDARLKAVGVKTPDVKVYDITLANIDGTHVHGYFGKLEGNGPFPAVMYIPGAGVGSASVDYAESMAAKGFLVIAISVHDLPNGQPAQFYEDQYSGPLKKYYLQGRESRDTYYFHRVILGCIRAIDYLTSRSEWDHQHMIVNGSSQGGGLTLIATGLDSRVTAAAANVPALCDQSGRNFGRPSGWPQLASMGSFNKLDSKILRVAGYYDAVNFAGRIKVPMIFGVGLIDNTCPPTTVFSAYNRLLGPKKIDIAPLMGHAFDPAYNKMLAEFVMKQGGKK